LLIPVSDAACDSDKEEIPLGCFIMNFSWLGHYCWDLFISTNGMIIVTEVLFKMFGLWSSCYCW